MSESENYLDELLRAVGTEKTKEEEPAETLEENLEDELDGISAEDEETAERVDEISEDDAFLLDFERELGEDDADGFLRGFERELTEDDAKPLVDDGVLEKTTDVEKLLSDELLFSETPLSDEPMSADAETPVAETLDAIETPADETPLADSMEMPDSAETADDTPSLSDVPSSEDGLPLTDGLSLSDELPPEDKPEQADSQPEPEEGAEAGEMGEAGEMEEMEETDSNPILDDIDQMMGEIDIAEEETPGAADDGQPQVVEMDGLTDFTDLFADDAAQPDESDVPEADASADGGKGKKGKKEKKKKEDGADGGGDSFMAKLTKVLFGEDDDGEEAEEDEQTKEERKAALLEAKKAKKEEKEKKKKEKQEKKPKKEKEPKPKKEKKPKPPKEPDRTPPLPKVPVALVFVMAISLIILVLAGTKLSGYTNSFSEAEKAYVQGSYTEAFEAVAGVSAKDADTDDYNKYRIAALVGGEYEAYESMMEAGVYDMALDSLIRTVGRYDKYVWDAEVYGCKSELDKIEADAETALSEVFGVSVETAREIYAIGDKTEYSAEIYRILSSAGYTEVAQ